MSTRAGGFWKVHNRGAVRFQPTQFEHCTLHRKCVLPILGSRARLHLYCNVNGLQLETHQSIHLKAIFVEEALQGLSKVAA